LNSTSSQTDGIDKSETNAIGLGEIFRLLRRRKFLILAVVVICTAASAVYTMHLPRRYEAVCRIDIDLNAPKSVLSSDSSDSASSSTEKKMATQLGILSSQSVAWDVIKKLRLDSRPEFTGKGVSSSKQDLNALPDVYRVALIRAFQGGLVVEYERGTEIAQIRYRSLSPSLSALIANTVAESYIERNLQTKYSTTLKTSTWLNSQLQSLRKQVSDAEQEFADFQAKTGLLQTSEGRNTLSDSVNQLNTALSAAETQRIMSEISFRESAQSDPDQVMPAGSLPTLQALRSQKADLEAQYASDTPKYGDAYPRVVQLKSQIAQVQAAIDTQIKRGRNQLAIQYQAAVKNEDKLRAAVDAQKQQIFAMNEDALRYSILQRQVVSSRDLYEDLTRKLQEAEITSGLSSDTISVIDPALAPNVPAEPRRTLNLEIGFLLGLILGVAIAMLLENINTAVRSVEDVTLYSGLPLISLVPHYSIKREDKAGDAIAGEDRRPLTLLISQNMRSHFAESFRNLRSALLLSAAGAPPQIIAVCSAWPREGKSTCAINLAVVLAQAGKRVLLVDADLKRPTLHVKLGLGLTKVGLSGLLTSPDHLDIHNCVHSGIEVPTLDFLPAGLPPPSSSELLLSSKMATLLGEWRLRYDFIVVDTAPVLAVSDTSALASLVDTIVLVVRAGETRRQSLRAVRNTLVTVRGKIAGVVLNDVKVSSDVYYDYYGGKGSYGGYYSEGEDV
jgi:capsular exopolysaccharide synthesis family protein